MLFAPKTPESAHPSRSVQPAQQGGAGEVFFEGVQTKQAATETAGFEAPFFQPKLAIHPPNDPYEVEADRVADQVLTATPVPSPPLQLSQEEDKDSIQSKPLLDSISRISTENKAQRLPAFFNTPETEANTQGEIQGKDASLTPPDHFEQNLSHSKGGGSALPDASRQKMESGFGADFESVKIHTDSNAVQMSKDIGAQAFTHGNDIYFNEGKFQPGTSEGDHLLAHELTHTVQQGGGVQSKRIQRAATTTGATYYNDPAKGQIDIGSTPNSRRRILINELKLPSVKYLLTNDWSTRPIRFTPRPTNQRPLWREQLDNHKSNLKTKIDRAAGSEAKRTGTNANSTVYFFKTKGGSGQMIIGTGDEIARTIILPTWNKAGTPTDYDVDHKVEYQLGGAHELSNFWLFERSANRSSGVKIKNSINDLIDDLVEAASSATAGPQRIWRRKPSIGSIKKNYEITIRQFNEGMTLAGNPNEKYHFNEIFQEGGGLDGLAPMTQNEINQFAGDADNIVLIIGDRSSVIRRVRSNFSGREELFKGFYLLSVQNVDPSAEDGARLGILRGELFRKDRRNKSYVDVARNIDIPFNKIPDLSYAGKVNTDGLPGALAGALNFPRLSPIRVDEFYIDGSKGAVLIGKILPTLPIFERADIDLVMEGDDIRLRKLFNVGEFSLPAPFEILDSTLEISLGNNGLGVEGRIDFAVQGVGDGFIGANANMREGFSLSGGFTFDTSLFDPATIEVEYAEQNWNITGRLGVPRGKVRGIRSALVEVNYNQGVLRAEGNAQLDIPGVQQGTLSLVYSNDEFSIGGAFQLSNEIPRLQSGSVQAQVTRRAAEEGYEVTASGNAIFDIPGINNATLNVNYANGALTIEGELAYNRDRLSGQVRLGATNRAIGEDGQPTGAATSNFRIYGEGSLTLRITPWLEATAGVRFLPNGEIEVRGRIGLPSAVNVFDERRFNRNLFSIPQIEIPIFAIPLGPKSIGLVATINGGLDFTAGFGPGQIQELYGEVVYNPAHPEQTTLSGAGRFVIPADAGLTLRADLGLGLSVGFASLTGGIEIAGSLGLAGEAAASVNVNWSPATGLELNALGEINVQPKFTFDINLLARASLNLPWPIPDLSKTWRHNLYSFQWGPDIQFGIAFPVHYKEGEPFDISADQVQVRYPDISIREIAVGLAEEIKDRVF